MEPVFPSVTISIVYILIGCFIHVGGFLIGRWKEKVGYGFEILAGILTMGWMFYEYGFPGGFTPFFFTSAGYMTVLLLGSGQGKYDELREEMAELVVEEVDVIRRSGRFWFDLAISTIIFIGGILFLIFGPTFSPLKLLIIYGLLIGIMELLKRFIAYSTVKIYYTEEEKTLYILSYFDSRKFPIRDMEGVATESYVDMLKLHPYLTLFTSNADFTTNLDDVLRLRFPGETVYLTVKHTEKWKRILEQGIKGTNLAESDVTVLPFYHRKNIKRLFGKLYFAITVKGISAYTALLLLLYLIKTPAWLMVIIAVIYLALNLYLSDRVLKTAMDANVIKRPEVIASARKIFKRAGISHVQVYEADSAEYNGVATGVNIGRSMITLTRATLRLPIESIEGILAHEAVHIKKRDVMWGQIIRSGSLLIIILLFYLIISQITAIEDYTLPLFFVIWLMIFLFPVYQSVCLQWMEVRADHLGTRFLDGGAEQMKNSLIDLAVRQDEANEKKVDYSTAERKKGTAHSSLDRPHWLIRILEFQVMPHPPMYWRIKTLRENKEGWGKKMFRIWLVGRWKESIWRLERKEDRLE